jgi:hypothetical protein
MAIPPTVRSRRYLLDDTCRRMVVLSLVTPEMFIHDVFGGIPHNIHSGAWRRVPPNGSLAQFLVRRTVAVVSGRATSGPRLEKPADAVERRRSGDLGLAVPVIG